MKHIRAFVSIALLPSIFLLAFANPAGIRATPQGLVPSAGVNLRQNDGTFLLLSDIHFDPLTGTDRSVIERLIASPVEKWRAIFESSPHQAIAPGGVDTNYALLAATADAVKSSATHYDYAIVTGDFLAHDFPQKYRAVRPDGGGYQEFAIKTIVFTSRMIQQAFPSVPVYQTLGNNDSVEADYAAPGRPLLEALAKEWKAVAANRNATRDFLAGGYYALPHPLVPSQELIFLDTAFWSEHYVNSPSGIDPGWRELAWLNSQLDSVQAAHRTAALLMHIPPGIDVYKSAQQGKCGSPILFWKQAYQDSFFSILNAHKAQLRDGYAGHTHIDDFAVLDTPAGLPFFQIHITPSISPNNRNHPAFETGFYDKAAGALVDYDATYLESSSSAAAAAGNAYWKTEYDFREISHFPSYSPNSLQTIALLIRSNDFIRQTFLNFYAAHVSANLAAVAGRDWLSYSCAQTELTSEGFSKCVCPLPAGSN